MNKKSDQAKPIPHVGSDDVVFKIRGLSKWYGDVLGLNDVSLDIGKGVVGLLGPNGAGKSTLLKLLSGQIKPSRGSVELFGQSIDLSPEIYSRMGYVPEQETSFEHMTGFDFVFYLAQLTGFAPEKAEKKSNEILETVQLSDAQDRTIETYSKGMRQRLKLAQGLVHDPEVLLLDEPLIGTDPIGRRLMIDLVQQLGEQDRTIVVSSHVLHEIEQMTPNILLINNGKLLAEGDIEDIRDLIEGHPHSVRVRTNKPRSFGVKVAENPEIASIRFDENHFTVRTKEPNETYRNISDIALEQDYEIEALMSPDDDLKSLFQYLTEGG